MQKTYALFDFDGTLIRGDSIILFIRYAWRSKLCSAADVLRFIAAGALFSLRLIPPKRAKEMGLRFLQNKHRAVYTAAAEAFCKTVLMPRLYPQGAEALQAHLRAGHEVLLISASPAFYLEPLTQLLGISAVLATRFSTDADGRFTDTIIGENCRGGQKPVRLREYLAETGNELSYETSSAYGDSTHDLPMLRLCAHAYAVNPNRKLRKQLPALNNVTVLTWKEKP